MTVLSPCYPFDTPWRQPGASSPGQNVRSVAAPPRQGLRRKRRFTLAALGLLCVAPSCFGLRTHSRPRQHECEANLKSLFTAIRTQQPQRRQASAPITLADFPYFAPERGNRYAYFLGPGPLEDRSGREAVMREGQMGIGVDTFTFAPESALTFEDLPPQIARQVGIRSTGFEYHFVAACAGDTDHNPRDIPDIWTVSNEERVINGVRVDPGEVFHHVNDATTY